MREYRMNRIWFLVLACCYSTIFAADVAFAKLDLRQLGYQFNGSTSVFADYTDLGFLSEDLVLISINQRGFRSVEPLFADSPESTIVVFDVKRGSVTATGKMSVEKMSGSVQAISGARFAVLNEKGLQFCDATLKCGAPIATEGPMFVSPQGKWVAVGRNGQSQQKVIDAESLKQVAVFEHGSLFQLVIPGEGAYLVAKNQFDDDSVTIQRPGKQDTRLTIDSRGNFRELRFLNSESLACLDHDASEVVVTDMDARPIRRYKVEKAWRTGFLPTASGTRFGIYEHGYTVLNSIVNFLDIDDGRPQDFQRVRVIDMSSGKEVSRLEWDPRPFLIKPALSPSGHRIARVRAGILEVFQVN
jgi:hypothetical protein